MEADCNTEELCLRTDGRITGPGTGVGFGIEQVTRSVSEGVPESRNEAGHAIRNNGRPGLQRFQRKKTT
jgi:hypothetical protein